MLAICKKELKLAFSGIFGYAVLAIQLFFLGLFFLLFNLLTASNGVRTVSGPWDCSCSCMA